MEEAIQLREVTKRYGRTVAVDTLTMDVRQGEVFGFVGENAAGKTTTIRMMLGMTKATSGSISVLGRDPGNSTKAHLLMAKIGYVSESREVYKWMRVREIIDFCRGIHGGTWDSAYAEKLRDLYGLDPQCKIQHLSNGKRTLLMLVLAVAHHPELLILDEPSSGLDPVARREILEQVINLVHGAGHTVFFSSHLLDEVERVADRVGFMRKGQLLAAESLANLHDRWRRLRIVWPDLHDVPSLAGLRNSQQQDREMLLTTDAYTDQMMAELQQLNPVTVQPERMSLDDIFVESMRSSTSDAITRTTV